MTAISAIADVDICSMALSHLGISTTIQSLNPPDQSAAGQACAFWYPKCRNQLLQSAPWNFAYTYLALASDVSQVPGTNYAFPGWMYAYEYPNDCLQPLGVSTSAGIRVGNSFWNTHWWPYPTNSFIIPKVPFRIFESTANPGQLAIACDLSPTSPVYLFYIQCVTNTALYDPMFSEALSYELASKIGGPLRADLQKIQAAQQMASSKRQNTLAQHMNAAQQDLERDSPSVQARR